MSELPRHERLQVRVLIGTLKMLEGQLRELPLELRDYVGVPDPDTVQSWRLTAAELHAATVDAPEPTPVRPKTMDAGP